MTLISDYLDTVKNDVDERVNSLIPAGDEEPQTLHQAVRWSIFAGGKRVRPAIVIAAGEALGASRDSLITTAAAVEMVHTYSLIHDDLPSMDNDDLRRGKATCHRQFGEASAILAGDVLQTFAFRSIANDEILTAETRVKLISLLATASASPYGMASGQQLDLEAEGRMISVEELEKIHREKTGALISAAATAGSIIAQASESDMGAMGEFSSNLGLLFQVTDDLLDVTQETAELGKTAGKDELTSKATYPAYYGINGTRKLALEIRDRAVKALAAINGDTVMLRSLADFVLDRMN